MQKSAGVAARHGGDLNQVDFQAAVTQVEGNFGMYISPISSFCSIVMCGSSVQELLLSRCIAFLVVLFVFRRAFFEAFAQIRPKRRCAFFPKWQNCTLVELLNLVKRKVCLGCSLDHGRACKRQPADEDLPYEMQYRQSDEM